MEITVMNMYRVMAILYIQNGVRFIHLSQCSAALISIESALLYTEV